MPAGKISEDTVTAIRSALEDGHYREVSRLVGIAWIDRKTLLNWLKRGEREKSGCTWLSSELSPESFRDEEFHLKNIKTASAKNWFASAWYLERKHPERWAKRDPGPGDDGPKDEVVVIG